MTDLDEALERFARGDLEYAGGLSNHGPMAAEALVAIGHAALLPAFIDVYAPRLPARPPGEPIPEADRGAARGQPERFADWVATMERVASERGWRELLRGELPVLVDGLFAGATHGWLRVAHAVRALTIEDTPVRRFELALGLAYWHGRYQTLPGRPGANPRPGHGPGRALREGAVVPPAQRRPGLFFDAVGVLEGDAAFVSGIEAVDLEGDPGASITDLCRAGAALYLENPGARIAYVHTVTAPSALRLVADLLGETEVRGALGAAFQAAFALHAVSSGGSPGGPSPEVEKLAESPDEIRYRAACSLDEHAIKLAEACLREDSISPDPIFRLAAADAALHLGEEANRAC